jgi:hypothetical protein
MKNNKKIKFAVAGGTRNGEQLSAIYQNNRNRGANNDEGCAYPCLNGGTCSKGRCICRVGYVGEYCNERKCTLSAFFLLL